MSPALLLVIGCVVCCVFVAIPPYTKEKFWFAGVVLLMAALVLGSGSPDAGAVKAAMNRAKGVATSDSSGLQKFADRVETGSGGAPDDPADSDTGAEDVVADVPDYPMPAGQRSLYRREVEIHPLGRVRLAAPTTPGISALTEWTPWGPGLDAVPTREPLGVLSPR